jgi:hypothetical protein
MNERIKELAKQVYGTQATEQEIKFAELIVRECADVGSKFSMAHPEDIRYQIKRHFGVEE